MTGILKVDTIQSSGGTTGLTIDSSGYLFAKLPHFCIKQTTVQSFDSSQYNRVAFQNTVADTHSFADLANDRINFTSTTAGVYQVHFGGKMENISSARVGYWIRKEGVANTGPYIGYFEAESSSASYIFPTFSFIFPFAAGDFLELDLYHTHGSARNSYIAGAELGFFMSGVRIG